MSNHMMRVYADPDVPKGICVMSLYGEIIYVGPIGRTTPRPAGAVILLNPLDFDSLRGMLATKH